MKTVTVKGFTFMLILCLQICSGEIIDLSYDYANDGMVFHPAEQLVSPFNITRSIKGNDPSGVYWEMNNFCTGEHTGTHMDAPRHSIRGSRGINDLSLDELIGGAVKIDITAKTQRNRDYQCTVNDIKNWEKEYKEIPANSFFFLNTGWHRYWPDENAYIGSTDWINHKLHFPGLHPDAAKWLIERRGIKMYGVDCLSVDYGQTRLFEVHKMLLGANIPVLENVANLDKLPATGAKVFAIPMKIRDGTGAPTRVFAITGDASKFAISFMALMGSVIICFQC